MGVCDNLGKCPIYLERNRNELFGEYAKRFCRVNCEECKRREIRLESGMENVPKDLLPDGLKYNKSIFED